MTDPFSRKSNDKDKPINPALLVGPVPPPKEQNPTLPPASRLKVARYQDPYAKLRRDITRIGLIFVAPIVSVLIIALIVINALSSGFAPAVGVTTANQPSSLPDVPLPAGLRPVNRKLDAFYGRTAELVSNAWVPNYDISTTGFEAFNSDKPLKDINEFYDNQLIKNNKWQIIKRAKINGHDFTLYGRGTTNSRVLDGLLLDVEILTDDNIQGRSSLLDNKAKIGDNVVMLFKQRLILR